MNSKSTLYCVLAFVLGTVFLYMGFHSMKENSQFREKGQRAMFTPTTNEYTEHRERRGGGVYHRVFELHHGGRHTGNGEQHQHQHQ